MDKFEFENIYDQIDLEDQDDDFQEPEQPQNLQQWRKYLLALQYRKKELEDIQELKKAIIAQYDENIKKRKQKVEDFQNFLKACLLSNGAKTKSGGYTVDIPDIGKFTASSESIKIAFDKQIEEDERFIINKPVFSKEKASERLQYLPFAVVDLFENKVDLNYAIQDNQIIDKQSGEVIKSKTLKIETDVLYDIETMLIEDKIKYSIETTRSYRFPKIRKDNNV